MGPIGVQEMILIFILALLLFGPKKLPELARMLGKGLSEFRRAKNELTSTFNTHMQELEREARIEDARKASASMPPATPAVTPYAYAADEYGQASAGYGHDYSAANDSAYSNDSAYPVEPPVESHAEPVSGSVPRSNGIHPVTPDPVPAHASESKDEHSA
jgi:TatA/E family protein of Tat protein translocase